LRAKRSNSQRRKERMDCFVAIAPRKDMAAMSDSKCQTAGSLSSPAKAGDPVFQRRPCLSREAAAYWMPAFAGMTTEKTRLRILAARSARSDAICDALEKRRGRRESRVPSAPAIVRTKCTRVTARCAGTPGLPCAMVLRLIARSPRRRIPLATVADGLTIRRHPVGPDKSPSA
jgi:hypothetical protein